VTGGHQRNGESWAGRLREAGVAAAPADALGAYLAMLDRWGAALDLVGGASEEELISDHVLESLAALPWVGPAGTLLDIGSGNGFPAIPLLLGRPGVKGVLLEPRERRWAFLREVVRELRLDAEVVRQRVADHRGRGYAVVTVRGVAMAGWLPHAARLLDGEGTWLWWTSAANARTLAQRVKSGRVLTSPLPDSGRGCLAVWRPCST
jgi:16S rRNA (guanine(527)-N(7))-methyltransferase RsmG